jgi:glycosyltransferase involved in cell wall biosynthesis
MRAFYTDLDLFCLSSLREGMPNVVLEAMAMSLPVVATSAGGLSTFLRDGDDALLCPPGRRRRLPTALRAAIRSPDLRARLGQAARTRVEQECSVRAAHAARVRRLRSAALSLERGRRRDATSRPQTHARVVAAAGG